jgi:hypothetical protein
MKYARYGETSAEQEEAFREAVRRVIVDRGGSAYGRGSISTALRLEGVHIPQNPLRQVMRELDPRGVESRMFASNMRRGEMQVAGPSQVFSVDGYDKLKDFGFEIYAFIDGYSRYVPQVYIGIDNRTAVSVLKQYLVLIRRTMQIPQLLRGDKGVETPLMAWAHVLLRRVQHLIVQEQANHGRDHTPLHFNQAFSWGKSTRNIRIERWWKGLAELSLKEYRNYFKSLADDGWYDRTVPDQIAIRYIYMPMLRARVQEFVDVHNCHRIRKQRQREHYLPIGKPVYLFKVHEGVSDYAEDAHEPTLQWLESLVEDVDLDAYLPNTMMNLCLEICEQEGFTNTGIYKLGADLTTGRDTHPHYRAYCILSRELRRRYSAGVELYALEDEAPRGGRAWIEKHISTEEDRENLDFFTGAAWRHLDLPVDLDNNNNQDNFDFDEDHDLSCSLEVMEQT